MEVPSVSDKYRIKPVPTRYKGILFDTRTEARWAAFLDRFGVVWSYHPFDLDGWFPDFLLTFPAVRYSNGGGETAVTTKREFLAEVKPITEFDWTTAEKMSAAHQGAMILLGRKPAAGEDGDNLRIGWWVDDRADEEDIEDWWHDATEVPGDEVILGMCSICDQVSPCSAVHLFHCRRCGSNPGHPVEEPGGWSALWAEAVNVTKYRPRS
ncbi:MAG: hypothetical protein F4Y12_06535 [Acidimicrobiaceae bacterium]|nr:hypothetical protein [Acidimicrobiaceae bacterium]